MTARPAVAALLAIAALGGAGRAQAPAATQPADAPAATRAAEKGMAGCERMMQAPGADAGSLEAKTAAMNAAQGPEKIEAMAAVVNALVARHRTMEEACSMRGGGMEHGDPTPDGHDHSPHDAPDAPSAAPTP